MPIGTYVWTRKWPPERGDIVMLREPGPPWKLPILLKRVEGIAGDEFCWHETERRHYINARPMHPIPPEAVHYALEPWRGCRILRNGEVVGYGDHPLAYGSQYLGPVPLDQIWGVYARAIDASFEIRAAIIWLYWSAFPRSTM